EAEPPATGAGDGAAPAAPDVPDARPTRSLVVDDEPSLREVQRRLLMLEGFDVLLAENSTQARELLSRNQVDLVVSDLRMPGDIDGLGLLASLEQDYPELAATALLVTGDVSGTAAGSLPVPDARLIRKPFTRTEYVSRVRVALAQRTG
ncbi:MAG: response regulator, partial [Gemmatimonadaceae bacterium]|nr:response regulator [Gemmatimonadaceae bacterium]